MSHAPRAAQGCGASVPGDDSLLEADGAHGLPRRREEEGARDTPQVTAGRDTDLPHGPEGSRRAGA